MDIVERVSKQLFELSPVAIIVIDAGGKVVKVNGELLDVIGYKKEEIEGKRITALPFLPLKTKLLVGRKFLQRIRGNEVEPYIIDFIAKNGDIRKGRIDAKFVGEGSKRVDLVMIADVTTDVKSERELRKLKLGLDVTSDVVFITDTEGVFEYVNQAFEKIYGYSENEWKGNTPRMLSSGYKDRKWYEEFWQEIKAGQVAKRFFVNKNKLGEVIEMESLVNPISGENGIIEGFLAVQRDVTKSRKDQKELQIRSGELEKTNKFMIDRELKMVELKDRIKELERQIASREIV